MVQGVRYVPNEIQLSPYYSHNTHAVLILFPLSGQPRFLTIRHRLLDPTWCWARKEHFIALNHVGRCRCGHHKSYRLRRKQARTTSRAADRQPPCGLRPFPLHLQLGHSYPEPKALRSSKGLCSRLYCGHVALMLRPKGRLTTHNLYAKALLAPSPTKIMGINSKNLQDTRLEDQVTPSVLARAFACVKRKVALHCSWRLLKNVFHSKDWYRLDPFFQA